MSQNMGFPHPNRVHVNELPVDLTNEELKQIFLRFNVNIRYVRIVRTNGATNYGFLTFESKEEADRILQQGRSSQGIVIRGNKVPVQPAFSRRGPPRRSSRQFGPAIIQGADRQSNRGAPSGMDAQHYGHNTCVTEASPDRRHADSAMQMHYPQTAQYWGYLGYLTPSNHGMPISPGSQTSTSPVSFAPNFSPGGATQHVDHPNGQWSVQGAPQYPFEPLEASHTRFGSIHQSYLPAHQQMFLREPNEGVEAPTMRERSPESALVPRLQSMESSTGYQQHGQQDYMHQDQQLAHHHAPQQDLAQQQTAYWIPQRDYQRAMQQYSPSESSACSNIEC